MCVWRNIDKYEKTDLGTRLAYLHTCVFLCLQVFFLLKTSTGKCTHTESGGGNESGWDKDIQTQRGKDNVQGCHLDAGAIGMGSVAVGTVVVGTVAVIATAAGADCVGAV